MPSVQRRLVVVLFFILIGATVAGFGLGSLNSALWGGIVGLTIGIIVSLNNFIAWAVRELPGFLIGIAVLVIIFIIGILIVKTGSLWCNPQNIWWYRMFCN